MTKIRTRALGAALAAGALVALPAAASAHPGHGPGHAADPVAKVTAQTERADAALDRAADLFAAGRERPAAGAVHRSQAALRHAMRTTARVVRKADTDEERGLAASAVITVATEMDEQIPTLVGLLDTATSARADLRLARAALADARGREKAIEVLNDLVKEGLPAESQAPVAAAITALSTDRSAEIAKATAALEDPDTSEAAGKTIRLTIDVTLHGRERAADILRQLIEQLPETARPGLRRALHAVQAERVGHARPGHRHRDGRRGS
jgi:hypothetical protein